ncbi:ribbon-helix-helix domain-containing protein [Ornithinimicrobium cryptoxanthini]|uniref:ribbon-helix-helix domain-containing protein n=1 Tax=Ornithinimicrobium cryptoxanthini TaxID=2934161 RepID=UPI0022B5EC2B|nr:ribbon-helix-helix domain-containing protein [Ornithinimicrobium cryptoxanthini]
MTTQIAIRLPDELVAFLDRAVAEGRASSRASVVTAALEREIRRQLAEQDAEILRVVGPEDDLDDLVFWTVPNAATED